MIINQFELVLQNIIILYDAHVHSTLLDCNYQFPFQTEFTRTIYIYIYNKID